MKKFLSGIARTTERKMDPRKKPAEMPDEALSQSLGEALDFEAVLDSIELCGQRLSDAMPSLRSAPSALMASLGAFCSKEPAGSKVVGCVSAHLDACAARVTHGMSHLESMAEIVRRARSQIATIREIDGERRTAWVAKLHSEQQFKSLMMRRRKISNEAKSARMKSRYEAEEEFKRLSDEMRRLVHEFLSSRHSNMAAAFVELSRCYGEVFWGSPELAGDLAESLQHLACMAGAHSPLAKGAPPAEGAEVPLPPTPTGEAGSDSGEAGSDSGSTTASSGEEQEAGHPLLDGLCSATVGRTETGSPVLDVDLVCGPPLPPPSKPPLEDSAGSRSGGVPSEERYLKGEKVSVWSESHCKWLTGVVQEVFTSGGAYKDYAVPAGVVQVQSSAGVKFVPPEELDKLVRRVSTENSKCGGTPFRPASVGSI